MLTEHAEPFRETTLVMAGDSVRSAPPGPDLGADPIVGLELRGADSVPGDAVEALGVAVSAHRRRLGRQRLAGANPGNDRRRAVSGPSPTRTVGLSRRVTRRTPMPRPGRHHDHQPHPSAGTVTSFVVTVDDADVQFVVTEHAAVIVNQRVRQQQGRLASGAWMIRRSV